MDDDAMTASRRRITLRHLADELGVSAKTVSNAFTRPDQLSPELRERVLATAALRGYPGPDPLAAGLRRGHAGAVGVAYDNGLAYAFDDPVAVQLLAGATSVLEPAGSGLLLVPGSADPQRSAAGVTSAVVDGLLAASLPDDDPVLLAALARRVPLVVIDQPAPKTLSAFADPPPWIGINDRAAAAAAAEHLLHLGHRRLGVVSFPLRRGAPVALADPSAQRASPYAVTRDRLAGYRDAATTAGLDWPSVPVMQAESSDPAGGAAASAVLLARIPRPTALLCLSDRLAEGAVRAAHDAGLRVPDDLSIVGFDDAEPAVRLGLTTVHHPHRRKGELAAAALLALVDGRTTERATELPTQLSLGSSTAAPPPDG